MIETGKQAIAAIAEIQQKTDWSMRRVSIKSGIGAGTLSRINSGETPTPNDNTLQKLQALFDRVQEI